jgi:hypothetical protein
MKNHFHFEIFVVLKLSITKFLNVTFLKVKMNGARCDRRSRRIGKIMYFY